MNIQDPQNSASHRSPTALPSNKHISRQQDPSHQFSSTEHLQIALDAANMGMWQQDLLQDQFHADDRCYALFELPRGGFFRYEHLLALLFEEDRAALKKAIEWSLDPSSDGAFSGEHRIIREDGLFRWLAFNGRTIFEGNGTARRAMRIIGTVRDVTEERQAHDNVRKLDAELLLESQRWRTVIEGMADEVWVADIDARMSLMNLPAVTSMQLEEFKEKSLPEVLEGVEILKPDGTVRPLEESPLIRSLRGETVRGEELLRHRETGLTRWRQYHSAPIHDATGRIAGAVAVVRDIDDAKRIEEQLRRTESRYRGLNNSGIVGVALFDSDGTIYEVNDAFLAMIGFTQEDIEAGKVRWDRLTPPEWMPRTRQALEEFTATGRISPYEKEYLRKDGSKFWGLFSGARLDSERGGISIVTDITDRKQIEEALRKSERQFRTLIENLNSGVAMVDETGAFIVVNPAFLRLFGFAVGEPISNVNDRDWSRWQVFGEDGKLLDVDEHPVRKAALTLHPVHNQLVGMRSPGSSDIVWMLVSAEPMLKPDGSLDRMICHYLDITDRKRAEEQVHRSEEIMKQAGELAHLGAWEIEFRTYDQVNPNPLIWSDEVYRIFGYEPGSVDVTNDFFFQHVPAEDRPKVSAAITEAIAEQKPYAVEHRVVRPNGEVRTVLEHADIIFDHSGQPQRIIGAVQDVTDRKQAEEQIRRYNERLEQLVEERAAKIRQLEEERYAIEKQAMIGRMVARVAHEINNPLAGIGMSFNVIKKAIPPEHPRYDFVGRIERELGRLSRMVRQMLDVNKPVEHKFTAINPALVIGDVLEMLAVSAHSQGIVLEADLSPVARNVKAQEDALRQVLFGLVQNAIEASPESGMVRVKADIENKCLQLTIADQGPGISEALRNKIFEPFFTTKTGKSSGGLGLGLAIAQGLVQALNGEISFKCEPGQGTVFHVSLPVEELGKAES